MMDIVSRLEGVVGKHRVVKDPRELKNLSKDRSFFVGNAAAAAVRPRSAAQVSRIMRLCNELGVGVVVHGAGSSLTGSSVVYGPAIVIDMSDMCRLLELHLDDGYVVVETGMVIGELNRRLARYGYFYPPDPASSAFASIGGSISTNAGGLRAVMYGSTREWVMGLEAVLPSGETIRTGRRTVKKSAGYDLTSLIVGSEGTLCVVTKAILKVVRKPEAVGRLVAYYRNPGDAVSAVLRMKRAGLPLMVAEFLDSSAIRLVEEHGGVDFPKGTEGMLMIDVCTTRDSLGRILGEAEIAIRRNALEVYQASNKKGMEKLYKARRMLYEIAHRIAEESGKEIMVSDVVVPVSELPKALKEIRATIARRRLHAELFCHIGDGNIHVNVTAGHEELGKVSKSMEEFALIALRHGGSVSGEHGIGVEKKRLFIEELERNGSVAALEKMRQVKKAFDPKGILNRGKIFD